LALKDRGAIGMVGKKIGREEAAKILSDVKPENAFIFSIGEGAFTGKTAQNLGQLFEALKAIDLKSVEFHLYRRDFENWVKYLGDNILALQIARIRSMPFNGEGTRAKITVAIGNRIDKLKTLESSP
jgi:hypothetical protein